MLIFNEDRDQPQIHVQALVAYSVAPDCPAPWPSLRSERGVCHGVRGKELGIRNSGSTQHHEVDVFKIDGDSI